MRWTSWLLSFLLHVSVFCLAVYWPGETSTRINLNVPVYNVELVSLAGKPEAKPGPPAKKAPARKKPAPEKAEPPKPKPKKPAPEKAVPVKAKPAPKKAEPKPEPPKPKAKQISTKKETPESKPAPKKPAPKKAEPKPAKPEKKAPTPQQLLAQALRDAQNKAAREEKKRRSSLDDELASISREVEKQQALADASRAVNGEGGGEGGTGNASLETVYLKIVEQVIRENWSYPNLATRDNPTALVEIRLDAEGRVLDYALITASGRPDYDSSVLKAVQRTRELPAPPKPSLRTIRINFNLQE